MGYHENATKLAAADPRILKNQAELLYNLGRHTEAMAVVEAGLRIPPQEISLLELRALLLIAIGRAEEAFDLSRAILPLGPRRLGIWKCLAVSSEMLGKPAEAKQACLKALEIQPDDADVLRLWSQLVSNDDAL